VIISRTISVVVSTVKFTGSTLSFIEKEDNTDRIREGYSVGHINSEMLNYRV